MAPTDSEASNEIPVDSPNSDSESSAGQPSVCSRICPHALSPLQLAPSSRAASSSSPSAAEPSLVVNPLSFFSNLNKSNLYDPLLHQGPVTAVESCDDSHQSSEDPMYEGMDPDWAETAAKRPRLISSVINLREKSPALDYEDIPILTRNSSTAKFCDQWFCCELCTAPAMHSHSMEPLSAPDIHKLVAFERGMWGCYTGNRFEQDYHYTKDEKGYSKLRRRADRKHIPVVNVRVGSSKTVDKAGFQLYVSN
jgi:hypothetical protein